MKKFVSLLLALMLALAATSALALSNISEISGLPDMPELPKMKVKSSGDVVTVTLDAPVAWMSAVRDWSNYTSLEFDENNVAVYSRSGDKINPGFAYWGWDRGSHQVWKWEEDVSKEVYDSFVASSGTSKWKDGNYGEHYYDFDYAVEYEIDDNPAWKIVHETHFINGGSYAMAYAYHGATADGVNVYYDTHGLLIKADMEVTGQNFFGSETAPTKSKITWSSGNYCYYISNITEEFEDGTTISADFAHNGKCNNYKVYANGELVHSDVYGFYTWNEGEDGNWYPTFNNVGYNK